MVRVPSMRLLDLKVCCNKSFHSSEKQTYNLQVVVSFLWISDSQAYTFRNATTDSDKMGCMISQVVAYWFACVQTPGISFCFFLIDLYFSSIVHQYFLSMQQIEKKGSALSWLSVFNISFRSPLTLFLFRLNYFRQFCFL